MWRWLVSINIAARDGDSRGCRVVRFPSPLGCLNSTANPMRGGGGGQFLRRVLTQYSPHILDEAVVRVILGLKGKNKDAE